MRVVTRGQIVSVIVGWWALYAGLLFQHSNPFGVLNVVGVLFLLVVPGSLALVILRIRRLEFWGRVSLTVGFSILLLMIAGLISNGVLPHLGVVRPLDLLPIFGTVSLLVALLLALAWRNIETVTVWVPRYGVSTKRRDLVLAFTPLVFIALSVAGAIRLNNGAGNQFTLIMLMLMGVYVVKVFIRSVHTERNVLPTILYFLSLTLLFMTSLRGEWVAGHDIQREFFVFQAAKDAGIWSVEVYRDAYNACLSITILPTLFSNLLMIADPYLYKVLYPMLFALTPVIAYLISRNWIDRRMSFLAAVLFMAFPTFFQDMPFLARQEIAFLFYGLMLYILFKHHLSMRVRRFVFVVMGVGVVLSHYSTTYTTLFVFALATIAMPVFLRVFRYCKRWRMFRNTAIDSPLEQVAQRARVTWGMVLILGIAGVGWTTLITNTDSHARSVVRDTIESIAGGGSDNDRSVDVLRIVGFGGITHVPDFAGYRTNVVEARRIEDGAQYYASTTFFEYDIHALTPEELPVTNLGVLIGAFNTNLVSAIGQVVGKVLQLAIVVGLCYVVVMRKRVRVVDSEYYLLALFSLVFIGMTMVLPVLSNEYGVFRALQQSMYIVAPFMVVGISVMVATTLLGTDWLVRRFSKIRIGARTLERLTYACVAATVLLFFWYATSFIPQLVGGAPPSFHLNAYGSDYRQYLVSPAEVAGIYWLSERARLYTEQTGEPFMVIDADRHAQNKLRAVLQGGVSQDLYPGLVKRGSYVYVGPATLNEGKATVTYAGRSILYAYPLTFLDSQKNLVYSNGSVAIYR